MPYLHTSNWINLAILVATVLAAIWARKSAKEAGRQQDKANEAAQRSASAAEQANTIRFRILEIQEQQQQPIGIICSD